MSRVVITDTDLRWVVQKYQMEEKSSVRPGEEDKRKRETTVPYPSTTVGHNRKGSNHLPKSGIEFNRRSKKYSV